MSEVVSAQETSAVSKPDGLNQLVRDIYNKENPEKAKRLTDDIVGNIVTTYGNDYKQIVQNIYEKENPEKAKRLNDDVYSGISKTYGFDEPDKIPTNPVNLSEKLPTDTGQPLTYMQKRLREKFPENYTEENTAQPKVTAAENLHSTLPYVHVDENNPQNTQIIQPIPATKENISRSTNLITNVGQEDKVENTIPQQKAPEQQYFDTAIKNTGGATVNSNEPEDSFSGNLWSDLKSGTKRMGFETGKAFEDQSLKIAKGIQSLSTNPGWQKYWDEQSQRNVENLSGLENFDKTIEKPKGGVGGFIGGLLPIVGMAAASVATKSPALATATTVAFAEMMYGAGIDTYDKFKEQTNQPVDETTRTGVGILYGVLGSVPFAGVAGKALKGVVGKSVQTALDSNPEIIQQAGKEIFESFAKSNPSIAKRLVEGGLKSVGNMEVMELGQKAVDKWMIGQNVSLKDFGKTALHAAGTGLAFAAIIDPFAIHTQNAQTAKRREEQGSVTITTDGIEVLPTQNGVSKGLSPDGKVVDLSQDQVKKSFTMTADDFNQAINHYKEHGSVATDIEQTAFKGRIRKFVDNLTDENGNISATQDQNGTSYFIHPKQESDGRWIGTSTNGESVYIDPKWGKTSYKSEDVFDNLMNQKQPSEQTAQTPVTTATIGDQQYTINNPEDLEKGGSAIFATDQDGNVRAVNTLKVTDIVTQTPEEINQAAVKEQEQQALMNGIDPNAQVLNDETHDLGNGQARIVEFNNGQSKVFTPDGQEHIVNNDEEANALLDKLFSGEPVVDQTQEATPAAPEKKIVPLTVGKTTFDTTEEDGYDEVIPSDKMPLEKALPILEKKFKDNENFELQVEKVQVEVPGATKYDNPVKQTVVKSIRIVPKNANNLESNTENVPNISEQSIEQQLVENTENGNNFQNEKLLNQEQENNSQIDQNISNEKPLESNPTDTNESGQEPVSAEGENTTSKEQGQGVGEGLEENVKPLNKKQNATKKRIKSENNIGEHPEGNGSRKSTATGNSNSLVNGNENQEKEVAEQPTKVSFTYADGSPHTGEVIGESDGKLRIQAEDGKIYRMPKDKVNDVRFRVNEVEKSEAEQTIEHLESISNYQTPLFTNQTNDQAAEPYKGEINTEGINQIKTKKWEGFSLNNRIVIHESVKSAKKAVVVWAHEKAHIQIRKVIPRMNDRYRYFNWLYTQITPSELKRVLQSRYNGELNDVLAEEYLAHLVEEFVSTGIIHDNVTPEFKKITFDIVNGFSNIKTIQDGINDIATGKITGNREIRQNAGRKETSETSSNERNEVDTGTSEPTGSGNAGGRLSNANDTYGLHEVLSGNVGRNENENNPDRRGIQSDIGNNGGKENNRDRGLRTNESGTNQTGLTISDQAKEDLKNRHNALDAITRIGAELQIPINIVNSSELQSDNNQLSFTDNGTVKIVSDRVKSVSDVIKSLVKEVAGENGIREMLDNADPNSTIGKQLDKFDELPIDKVDIDKLTQIIRKAFRLTSSQFTEQDMADILGSKKDESEDVRFKIVSNNKNLVALHNISEENIQSAKDRRGKLITPSLAIVQKGVPFTDFGNITLIGTKEMIDPQSSNVKVFKGDVYSPTVPRPQYEVDKRTYDRWASSIMSRAYSPAFREIASKVANVVEDFGSFRKEIARSSSESVKNNVSNDMRIVYIIEKGIDLKIPMKPVPFYIANNYQIILTPNELAKAKEFIDRFRKETEASSLDLTKKTEQMGYDFVRDAIKRDLNEKYGNVENELLRKARTEGVAEKITERVNLNYLTDKIGALLYGKTELDTDKYNELKEKLFKKKSIQEDFNNWLDEKINQFQGRKYFEKGNEKLSYTTENLVEATTGHTRAQEKGMTYGMNKAKASAIKQLKNIEEIRTAQKDLVTKEEMTRIEKELQDKYIEICNSIKYKWSDGFTKYDDFGKSLADYFKGHGANQALSRNDFIPSKYDVEDFKEFADRLKNSPIDYLEAKTQRAVDLSEFKYAVVPESTSKETIKTLKDSGIKVKKYGEYEQRTEIIKEIADKDNEVRFRILGETGAANLDKAEEVNTRLDNLKVAREMEQAEKDAKSIRLSTGWEKGVDGKWKYEVPDIDLNYTYDQIFDNYDKGNRTFDLSEIVNDDELFKAYPELKNTKINFYEKGIFNDKGGIANAEERIIRIALSTPEREVHRMGDRGKDKPIFAYDNNSIRSVLSHEIQHLIQSYEGFGRGGNKETVFDRLIQNGLRILEEKLGKENVTEADKQRNESDVRRKYGSPQRAYERILGEVESRNVQSRMNMTPEERRNTLLSETEDVAREDQIVLMDGLGVSNLEETPMDRAKRKAKKDNRFYSGSDARYILDSGFKVFGTKNGITKEFKSGEVANDAYENGWVLSVKNVDPLNDKSIRFRILGDPRNNLTNIRGSWTKAKIIKELKEIKKTNGSYGKFPLLKGIASFENGKQLKDHLFYHGTGGGVSGALYPSITMSEREAERSGGGGYGERYFAISVSKSKRRASIFSGQSNTISVYPVILNKDAKVIDRPDINDSVELEDIIEELWNDKVDAVRIGDWNDPNSEQELAVLNPQAISTWSSSETNRVYEFKLRDVKEKTDEELEEIIYKAKDAIVKLDEWTKDNPREPLPELIEYDIFNDPHEIASEAQAKNKGIMSERKKIREKYDNLKKLFQNELANDIRFRIEQERENVNTEPSEAQKEAGNYAMGHIRFDGFDISIENPKGSIRSGKDKTGREWSQELPTDYGYFRGTIGKDKDHVDVFLGDNPESDKIYVVDQKDPETGAFDEHKVLLGFDNVTKAKQTYLAAFEVGWQGMGNITRTDKEGLKEWFEKGNQKKPFADSSVRFRIEEKSPFDQLFSDLNKLASTSQSKERLEELDAAKSEAKREAKQRIIRQIQGFKEGYRVGTNEMKLRLRLIQGNIIHYANQNMPYSEAGKRSITSLLTAIKNANTPATIEDAFNKIDELTEKINKKTVISRIEKSLKKTKPKRVNGKLTGNLNPDIYKVLKKIRAIVDLKSDEDFERFASTLNEEDVESIALFGMFGNLESKSEDEAKAALGQLSDIVTDGKVWYKDEMKKRKEYLDGIRGKVMDKITGGKPHMTQQDYIASGTVPKDNFLNSYVLANQSLEWLLDVASKDKSEEAGEGWMQVHYGDLLNESTNKETKGVREAIELVNKAGEQIFGVKENALARIFTANSKVVENSGVTFATNEGRSEIPLSQNQAAKRWMEMQDPTLIPTFEKQGWDDKSLTELESFMTPEVKKWAEWQLNEFYPEYFKATNETFRNNYFVDMPFNPKYSPIRREVVQQNSNDGKLLQGSSMLNSVMSGSFISRIANINNILLQDANSVLFSHISEMEHFKAWIDAVKEMRSTLGSRDVQHAIKFEHGNKLRQEINNQINDFASGGSDKANVITLIDRIRGNFAVGELALNLSLFPKQAISILTFLADVPVKNYVTGLVDMIANMKDVLTMMKSSEFIKERYLSGWNYEVRSALKKETPEILSNTKSKFNEYKNKLMFPAQFGDYTSAIGGWTVYKYNYEKQLALELLKPGITQEQAEENANKEAMTRYERSSARLLQSSALKDAASIQKGSFGKMFAMFKSQPQLQQRYESAGWRNLYRGRGSKAHNLKLIALFHVLLPVAFQAMANIFTNDDDDEKKKRLWIAGIIGSLNGFLIASDVVEFLIEKATGSPFDYSLSPLEGSVNKIGTGATSLVKGIKNEEGDEEKANEQIFSGIDQIAYGINNIAIGLPYRPTKKIVKQIGEITNPEKAANANNEKLGKKILFEQYKYNRELNKASKDDYHEMRKDTVLKKSMNDIDDFRSDISSIKKDIRDTKDQNYNITDQERGTKLKEFQDKLDSVYGQLVEKYKDYQFPKSYKLKK